MVTHYSKTFDDTGRPLAISLIGEGDDRAAGQLPEGWDDLFWDWQPRFDPEGAWVHLPELRRETLLLRLREQRNTLLDTYRWTVTPDSPLTEACKAEWSAYLQTLHRLTVDFPDGENVVWPELPSFSYV